MNGLTLIDGERIRLMEELLHLSPAEKAYIEVSNLLAATPINQISDGALLKPLQDNRIDLEAARPRLRILYAHVLQHFILDRRLTDEEVSELDQLRGLLGLTQADVEQVFSSVVHRTYEQLALRSSADEVPSRRVERLTELSRSLKIPDDTARKILSKL
jgi:hypothetical protein